MNDTRQMRLSTAALAVALLAIGLPNLRDYGVNWDEALGDLFYGERYLSYFTSFDPIYLDPDSQPYPQERSPDLSVSAFRGSPWEYYPVANILGAASSAVLARWLGALDPFDAFHAINLMFGALLIVVLVPFVWRQYGRLAAWSAIGFFFLAPRVWAHLMANTKDFPLTVLFALTLLAFHRALVSGSVWGIVGAGAVWGLALGCKANALFIAPIVGLCLLAAKLPDAWNGRRLVLWSSVVGAGAVGAGTLVLSWPYLWPDPVGRLWLHFEYISGQVFVARPDSLASPVLSVLYTTPLPFLACFAVGVVPVLREVRQRRLRAVLLALWIGVTVGRMYLPGAVNFDGVRHFLELFVPMAVVAGIGVAGVCAWSHRRLAPPRPHWAAVAVLLLVAGFSVLPVARTHPFQIAYWNALVGGLPGARAADQAQAGDYWGLSYRRGLRWLNQHAPPRSVLVVPVAEHIVRLVAPTWLDDRIGLRPIVGPSRPDIDVKDLRRLRRLARRRPVFVMFVVRDDWDNELTRACKRSWRPVASWQLEGEDVLLIYRHPGTRLASGPSLRGGGLRAGAVEGPARVVLGGAAQLPVVAHERDG